MAAGKNGNDMRVPKEPRGRSLVGASLSGRAWPFGGEGGRGGWSSLLLRGRVRKLDEAGGDGKGVEGPSGGSAAGGRRELQGGPESFAGAVQRAASLVAGGETVDSCKEEKKRKKKKKKANPMPCNQSRPKSVV